VYATAPGSDSALLPFGHRISTKSDLLEADTQGVILALRKLLTRRRLQRLIRDGVGVRESAWALPSLDDEPARALVVQEIAGWVRESMGEMRRPYGIDHVALALACRDASGRIVCTNSLGVIRPTAFYGHEGIDRIAAFMDDLRSVPAAPRGEVVGALLSLGDLAYQLDLARAA
jgi:hypothetical protein